VAPSSDTETAATSKSVPFGLAAAIPVQESEAVLKGRPPGGYGFPFNYKESKAIVIVGFLLIPLLVVVVVLFLLVFGCIYFCRNINEL
jgi:hypothetical protein